MQWPWSRLHQMVAQMSEMKADLAKAQQERYAMMAALDEHDRRLIALEEAKNTTKRRARRGNDAA